MALNYCVGSNYYRAVCISPVFSCPANSQPTGNSCTCNDPYVPDSTATSCVLEQYTIALSGLGGEVIRPATRDAYATVTASNGSPKSGAQVSLTLTVVPEDDGQLFSSHVGSISPNGGATGADGMLKFVFTAPVAGGTHTITATCVNCTNQATGIITVPGCPVSPLTKISDFSVLEGETPEQANLTNKLEGRMNGYSLLTQGTQNAEQCLAGRIAEVVGSPSTSGYRVTSTVRTFAYQRHLKNVWDKFFELQEKVDSDPTIQQRCQSLITKVEGEMGFRLTQDPTNENTVCDTALGRAHCLRTAPAQANPKHTQNIAFDISLPSVLAFRNLLVPPRTVQQEANACGLTWGGTFTPIDNVHFVLQ